MPSDFNITEKVSKWILAELKANSGIIDVLEDFGKTEDQIQLADVEMPIDSGVYVGIIDAGDEDKNLDVGFVTLRLTVFSASGGSANGYKLWNAVIAAMTFVPGFTREWNVDPSDHNLKIKRIDRDGGLPLQLEGDKMDGSDRPSRGVLQYRVLGTKVA